MFDALCLNPIIFDGSKVRKKRRRKETCIYGHSFSGDNVYEYLRYYKGVKYMERVCKKCRSDTQKKKRFFKKVIQLI